MKLCWIVVLVGISIILVFLYSLVAMSSRTERFIEQLMEEEGRKDTDEQDMEAIITEGKERQEHE
jgi:Na+-transporting methylmalonyl-CoA/oxaloacetate decarboxylase gamma subunit